MKRIFFFFFFLAYCMSSPALHGQEYFRNPILPGGYPDPTVCRVGGDFYIVNSSFEYFPGLPVHHSTDLINWRLAGYALQDEQHAAALGLGDVQTRGGIHAPTIRYHDGLFYVITTSVYNPPEGGQTLFYNFIVTAEDVAGPWSEPHILEGAPGIDPDIFFDDDGTVWYVGTHSPDNPNFPGEGEIWLQRIDTVNWRLDGPRYFLWRGACGGVWAEGPHLYKKDGAYYLMVAEGGTSFNHAVTIAVSDDITGPYTSNERNPILTSRHLSYDNWVHSTGHADLVELADGRWYMVALGIRGDVARGTNMGRETHLVPVQWEREPFEWLEIKREWPVAAPNTGKVEEYTEVPFTGTVQYRNDAFTDNFDREGFNLQWNHRRIPLAGAFSLDANPGCLRIYAVPETVTERGRYAFVGFRQKQSFFEYSSKMNFKPRKNFSRAGIMLLQDDENFVHMTVIRDKGTYRLEITLKERGSEEATIAETILNDYKGEIIFRVSSGMKGYDYFYSLDGGHTFDLAGSSQPDILLSHGYTGAYLGLYATGEGHTTGDHADFDWVEYQGFE